MVSTTGVRAPPDAAEATSIATSPGRQSLLANPAPIPPNAAANQRHAAGRHIACQSRGQDTLGNKRSAPCLHRPII